MPPATGQAFTTLPWRGNFTSTTWQCVTVHQSWPIDSPFRATRNPSHPDLCFHEIHVIMKPDSCVSGCISWVHSFRTSGVCTASDQISISPPASLASSYLPLLPSRKSGNSRKEWQRPWITVSPAGSEDSLADKNLEGRQAGNAVQSLVWREGLLQMTGPVDQYDQLCRHLRSFRLPWAMKLFEGNNVWKTRRCNRTIDRQHKKHGVHLGRQAWV